MRTTVTVDDALYEKALEMADPDMDRADTNFINGDWSVNTGP